MADATQNVNGKSPPDAQARIGHNNPPPALTAKVKLQRIEAIIERVDLTAAQKCVGVGIVVKADRDGVAEAKTQELMTFASVKDRETVFRATKTLHEKEVVEKANKPGQSGRYNVLPPRVIEAIIAAHDKLQSGRSKPDGTEDETDQAKPDGVRVTHPVRSDQTSDQTRPGIPVGSNPTASDKNAPAPARIVSPSGIYNIQQKQQPTTTPESEPESGSGLDFDALNGAAVDLIDFIAKYASVDKQNAAKMLNSNVRAFTADAMVEAFSITIGEMATGGVASPYKYLMTVAREIKAKAKSGGSKPVKGISRLKEKFLRAGE